MNNIHISYKLDKFSGATRYAKKTAGNNYFFLGRISKYKYLREKQLFPFFLNFIGIFGHIINITFDKLFSKFKGEIFNYGFNFKITTFLLKKAIKKYNIDTVYLHWGGYNFLIINSLFFLKESNVKFLVVSHDYHQFTGGCHIPMDCKELYNECKNCPRVSSSLHSHIHKNMLRKKLFYKNSGATIIALSSYSKKIISNIISSISIEIGPKPNDEYFELNKESISDNKQVYFNHRNECFTFFLPGIKKSLLDNKGAEFIVPFFLSFKKLHPLKNIVILSQGDYIDLSEFGSQIHTKRLDHSNLKFNFRISDFTLLFSKYETFSQITLESVLCFTPVVAFKLSGPKDIVIDNKTGFLVKFQDVKDFALKVSENLSHKRNNINVIELFSIKTSIKYS
jgi:glycosyltransferase involved in cell wall biosynthesis